MQQVENVSLNRLGIAALAQGLLHRLKAALAPAVKHDRLHVEHGRIGFKLGNRRVNRRKFPRPVIAIARDQPSGPVGEKRQQPVAVELDFVQPLIAFRRTVDQCCELDRGIFFQQAVQLVSGFPVFFRRRRVESDFIHRALGLDARVLGRQEIACRAVAARRLIPLLDQQPVLLLALLAHAHKVPAPGEALAVQDESQMTFLQRRMRFALRLPASPVPQHDRAAAIFALRDCPFECSIRQRMVFGVHGQPFVGRIKAWSLRDSPAQQNAVEFQPEIVMQPRGVMFLDQIGKSLAGSRLIGRRFRRSVEMALALVFFQGHRMPRSYIAAYACALENHFPSHHILP